MKTLAQEIAGRLAAIENCRKSGNAEWQERHTEALRADMIEFLPSGSGFDSGTQIDLDASRPECLVFRTAFHHMNENGFYDGWTDHVVRVRPSLVYGLSISVSGRDRNDIKDHIHGVFYCALDEEVTP